MISSISIYEESQQEISNPHINDNILIIENDLQFSNLLQSSFVERGYKVEHSIYKGQLTAELKSSIGDKKPQLIVLNIDFIAISQLTIIHEIRQVFNGPLIVLTAKVCETEEIQAFNYGADEYLIKPISTNVLSVRIRALLSRFKQKTTQSELASLSSGDICLEPKAQRCFVNGKVVKLTGIRI